MKPQLAYPLDGTITVNQPFGANQAYYEAHFGQNGHPGIDFAASHGTPVYAAHNGDAYAVRDAHGGEGVWVYAGSYITISFHLIGNTDPKYPVVIPFDYQRHPVKKGDLIGYADNTGAPFESSGDHLHFGLMLANNDAPLNTDNGTQGCIDPQPYFDGTYAHQEPQNAIQTPATAPITQDLAELSNDLQKPSTPQTRGLISQALSAISQWFNDLTG